ncbi:putative LPS assembly protein LptD [Pontibacter liquoris]|uniref:putative LPS assembly protein LptD n=1 Tax=Pontibacter liquoris TaxID=2905677 RepID=UPI001FA7FE72|nr:putative LPS assembly protein LptD [Pontibacter liquoris]
MIFLLLLQFSLLSALTVKAQTVPRTPVPQQDTLTTGQDSLTLSKPKGDIETTIKYSARDSIQFEVGRKVVHLFGDAKINYGTMSLEAAYIEINYDTNTLTATTGADSTGKQVGVPVFVNGSETYAAKRIAYNYKSKKGRISDVVTQQGEGYIHAEVVKKNELDQIYGLHARYTTCNLEHPHFYINATRIKAIPNDKVMSGPFNLVISGIPTPLGFLFGLFPTPRAGRSSGVIVPSFGESGLRGFYLQDGGYYFAWNDYVGTSLTGSIYSLGSYDVSMATTYNNRYKYRGNVNFQYSYFKTDEADVAQSRSTDDLSRYVPEHDRSFGIQWSHSPVPKPGQGRFSASVNARSSMEKSARYNSAANYLAATLNSTISYQKNIQNSPFSYGITLSQGQNTSGTMNFVLPDINLSMTQTSISELLTNKPPVGKWYEKFQLGYGVRFQNSIDNIIGARQISGIDAIGETTNTDTIAVNLNNLGQLWKNGRRSAVHNFSFSLGNYKVLRFLNFTPSMSYQETWLDQKYTYSFDPDSQKVRIDTARFGRVYNYSAGASLTTQVYGTYVLNGKRIQAIRHKITPSIGYSYRPDFGAQSFGFYQNFQTGVDTTTNLPIYNTLGRYSTALPGRGLQSNLNFSIQQNLEMKVKARGDSAAGKFEKVSLIDNLGISGSYNMAADAFRLSNINANMNTTLFKTFNVRASATFDPYKRDSLNRRIDEYAFDLSKLKLATLTNAQFGVSANLNPNDRSSRTRTAPTNLPVLQPDIDPLVPEYIDFKIPWTLSVDYTINYSKGLGANARGQANPNNVTQTLGLNGSLSLSEKWKISYTTGYDFTNQMISFTNVNINRDLHCWEMSIGWTPFGFQRGYNFTINARSALLRDLRLTKNRSGWNR